MMNDVIFLATAVLVLSAGGMHSRSEEVLASMDSCGFLPARNLLSHHSQEVSALFEQSGRPVT